MESESDLLLKILTQLQEQERDQRRKQIESVKIKKIEIRLSLVGKEIGTPLIECLWPRVTLLSDGKEKTLAFSRWRKMGDIRYARFILKKRPDADTTLVKYPVIEDLVRMVTGIRSLDMEQTIMNMGEVIRRKVQSPLGQAAQKKSFQKRHNSYMRKLIRKEGKFQLKKFLMSLPVRMERQDVIEAWQESIMEKIHDQ